MPSDEHPVRVEQSEGSSENTCKECLDEFDRVVSMEPDAFVPFVMVCPVGHMEYIENND